MSICDGLPEPLVCVQSLPHRMVCSSCSLCVSRVVAHFCVLSEKSENIQVQDLVKDCSVGDFKMSLRKGKRATGTELWL